MIPSDIIKHFPKIYQDKGEASMTALASALNTQISGLTDDVFGIGLILNPIRCPSVILDELGYMFAAGILPFDSEDTKRKKIYYAVQNHRNRTLFNDDVKIIIDTYVGGDCSLFSTVGYDDWICCGKGDEPAGYYWAGCGGKDASLGYGILMYGKGTEPGIKGNIYIDVDSSTLTATEVEEIKTALIDHVAAYFRYFLGYVTAGVFTTYANGIINE